MLSTAEAQDASRAMSDLMRGAVGLSPAVTTGSAAPLAQALAALETAKATGDEARIVQADAEVETLLDAARRHATPPPVDFGAGARPPAPVEGTGSDWMREEADRLRGH